MNDMTVGMENLPNVFINKIMIEPRVVSRTPLRVQYNIRVLVKMFDSATHHSWRNKVNGLKVKCAFISDERADKLNNGEISLYDIPAGALNRTLIESCDAFRFNNRVSGYESYTKTFEINVLNPVNLNVYVACFIDGLEFGIDLFDKFYGPMAAERIYIGGIANAQSGYFYNPENNEEYGGPVHLHNSNYMEGSEHSTDPHAGLRYVTEENYKIIEGSNVDTEVFAGIELVTQLNANTQEDRPGYVDPSPDAQLGPRTNIPDQEVAIEDPNVPTSPPTEIY